MKISPDQSKLLEQREIRLVEVDERRAPQAVTTMPGTMLMKNSQCQESSSVR